MKKWNKNVLPSTILSHAGVVLGFALVALLFYYPLLSGKTLLQSDIRQYQGMSRQLQEHREATGEETYWIDNAFGGMPTYQLGAKFPADVLQPIYSFFRILPRPAHILFLYLLGVYFVLLILKKPWPVALFGSLAFGFSTYLLIILQVGHNTKALAVSFFPFVFGGVLLLLQKRWFWGVLMSSLALGMQIRANHYQMTYYLLMLLGLLVLVCGYHSLKNKQTKSFLQSLGALIASGILALGFNATPLLATAEYTDFSTRGKSELKQNADGSPKEQSTGLDFDYITEYSYGIFESLNLIAPRVQGGGSSEDLGTKHGVYDFLIENGASPNQAREFSKNVPTYWGEQPILEAPAYIGITVFFFALFGFFFSRGPLRTTLALGALFSLLLSWGKNLSFLTAFFVSYFPLYNKFRAVSSIQVVLEFCLPMLAAMGLFHVFYSTQKLELKRFLKIAAIPIVLFAMVLLTQGMLSFSGANDAYFKEIYGTALVSQIREARISIFQSDLFRGILFCVLLTSLIYLYQTKKIKRGLALSLVIGLLIIDLIGISNRYIDREAFVSKRFTNAPFRMTAADEALLQDQDRFRVYEPQLGLTGARTAYFHNALGGYHGAKPRRFEELFEAYSAQQNTGILDFLNVKYILYPEEESGELKPLLNPNALGPAWMVSEIETKGTPDALLEALKEIDFKTTALVLDHELPADFPKQYTLDSLAQITLTKAKPDQLTYRVQTTTPAFAVFSEMHYPKGWKATLDGKPVPIINVNYVLRGVQVPANASVIEFRFEPAVIKQGTRLRWLSLGLFAISILVLGYYQYFKTKS
ncbi:MAG: YfhO family protein [Flavobacteriaceae bacterium]|nr:YfhO family protein [Flavobacteriaceae bacterium]